MDQLDQKVGLTEEQENIAACTDMKISWLKKREAYS